MSCENEEPGRLIGRDLVGRLQEHLEKMTHGSDPQEHWRQWQAYKRLHAEMLERYEPAPADRPDLDIVFDLENPRIRD